MRTITLMLGCLFMPFVYLGLLLGGAYTPLIFLYRSIFDHYKNSSEPMGFLGF